ncbi:hypothetical protein V6N11_040037 [Hibiscus sabdariffa]|uniref:Pentatricopeptide repeat-containing protein n=1 Tax=Hibiscus sabdariffa TaxID=183260 RepID=A0ABR2RG93_9ROSI
MLLRLASISSSSLHPLFQIPFAFNSLHHSLPYSDQQQFFSVRHVYDCNVRIRELSRAGDIKAARQLFDNMPSRDVVSWNSIISAYWQNGYLQEAKKLFCSMPDRNILSWNSMIAGCVQNGCLDEAFQYFKAMPQRNTESYNAMISGFVRWERVKDAGMLFQEMPRKNVISYTAMVDGYMKVGEFDRARALFDEMRDKNAVSWSVMISGYVDNGRFDEARELYQRMPNKNVVAMTAMITGYLNEGRVEDARNLFDGIRCKDLACWNAMLTGYAQNGIGEEALKLYLEMVKLAIRPNIFTLVSVFMACSGLAADKEGRQMHVLVIKYGFESDLSLCHSLITMYSKCGSILDAEQAFRQMNGAYLISWNTIISAFAQHGLYEKAVDFFNWMEVVGIEPDGVTFLSLLSACGHAGKVNESMDFFDLMVRKYGIHPRPVHYSCLVDILCRAGQLEKASKIIRGMPFEADGGVWGSLLAACSVYLNVELGELAAKKIVEWNPYHSGAYVVLSNIYAAAGMWDEVTRVRLQMKDQGVKKQCAYSWMEIGNKVHQFLGGDLSHPDTDKIHLEIKREKGMPQVLVGNCEDNFLTAINSLGCSLCDWTEIYGGIHAKRFCESSTQVISEQEMEGPSFANGEADESCTAMVSGEVADLHTELKNKERYIESLKAELGKAKGLEEKLIRKEASFRKLKKELIKLKSFEYEAIDLLSQGKRRIHELEEEIEGRKESEKKMYDSFLAQSKEYKRTQISLEKSKQEVKFLIENLEKSEGSSEVASQSSMGDDHLERVESELQLTKDNLACALEKERVSSLKAERLTEEVDLLKSQLKSTIEAEENNKKAMDDLAMALKEVKAEAEQTNETLLLTILELEKKRGEAQNLKLQLRSMEGKYIEAKKEADVFRNISERLRVEAEETQLAWSGKEKGFIECIKRVEDERNAAQEESKALLESLREVENKNIKAKGENQKLRDIMKQAINEANVAKEAATIARDENSQLKDTVSKKDEALSILSQENENLKINKATTADNVRDLKLLLYDSNWEERAKKQKAAASSADKDHKDDREQGKKAKHHKCSSACLNLTFTIPKNKDADDDSKHLIRGSYGDSDSDYSDDPLKGSIFYKAISPKNVSTTSSSHQRKKSSLTDDEATNGEEFVQIDTSNFDEESDRSSRKKKALLKRFGDLIRRKRFQKKEQILD